MRKERPTILYLFIFLIILAGLGLLVFKDNLAQQFLTYTADNGAPAVRSSAGDINLNVLRDSRIKALKNQVSIFDYNDLNKSQDTIEAADKAKGDVVISNPGETGETKEGDATSSKSFIRVRVGNSNPFIVNKIVR